MQSKLHLRSDTSCAPFVLGFCLSPLRLEVVQVLKEILSLNRAQNNAYP